MSFLYHSIRKTLVIALLAFLVSCNYLTKEQVIKQPRDFWYENNVKKLDQLCVSGSGAMGDSLSSWLSQGDRVLNHYEPFCELITAPNDSTYAVDFSKIDLEKAVYQIEVKSNHITIHYSNEQAFYAQQFEFLNEFKAVCHDLFVNQRSLSLKTKGYLKEEFRDIEQYHDWTIKLPQDFKIVRHKEKFLWIRTEMKSQNSHLLIQKLPFTAQSQFELSALIRLRDSLGQKHVLYKNYDSTAYMETEFYFPVTIKDNHFGEFYSKRINGAWAINKNQKDGFAMGGPFVGYVLTDQSHPTDIYYIEAFFSAPNVNKLPFIRTLEAILRTFELNK